MVQFTDQQIQEIYEQLEWGLECYIHKKSGEILFIPSPDLRDYADEEGFEKEFSALEEYPMDYVKIEKMSSTESFKIMGDFAMSIDNDTLQEKLINALNLPKPFKNFKYTIDNSGKFREKWFQYKEKRYIEWLRRELEFHFR